MRTNNGVYWKKSPSNQEVMLSWIKFTLRRISINWKSEVRKGYLSTDTKYVKYKETFNDFCIRFFNERMLEKEFKHKRPKYIAEAFVYICGVIYYNKGPKCIWFTQFEVISGLDPKGILIKGAKVGLGTVTKNYRYLLEELFISLS
jgi:mannosyltransferase OCH1-like enzyme